MTGGPKSRPKVPSELRPGNDRLEAFSDGVFAIVVTIMILEIRIPDELAFSGDPAALMAFTAAIATYALSFVVIAIFWSNHHYLIFETLCTRTLRARPRTPSVRFPPIPAFGDPNELPLVSRNNRGRE